MAHGLRRLGGAPLATACVLLLMGAGCLGATPLGEADEARARPDTPADPDQVGAIIGTATATSGVPLPGATVTLAEADIPGEVFRDGSFLFYPVPAGHYNVLVEAPGFTVGLVPVVVKAGEDTYADVVLTPINRNVIYRDLLELGGFIECAAEAGWDLRDEMRPALHPVDGAAENVTGEDPRLREEPILTRYYAGHVLCGTVDVMFPNTTNQRTLHTFKLHPLPASMVFETAWTAEDPMADELTAILDVEGFSNRKPGTWKRLVGESPLRVQYDVEAWYWMQGAFDDRCHQGDQTYCGFDMEGEGVPMLARVFPAWECLDDRVSACVVTDQTFTHYVSSFHGLRAPAGWTALEGRA